MAENDVPDEVIKHDISNLTMATMKPLMTQRKYMYIDLDLLFDFRLTALMSFIRGKEDYLYIRQHLDEYLQAPTLEVCKFFPKIGVTEEQLDEFLANPEYKEFIAALALPTDFLRELQDIIKFVNTENESKETHDPLKITLNSRYTDLHPDIYQRVVRAIHASDPHIKVELTLYKNWSEVPADLIKQQHMICVYDVRDFLSVGSTSQKLLADMVALSDCSIVGLKVSDLSEEDTQKGVDNLQDAMSLCCNKFTMVNKSLLTEGLNNG